MPPVLVRALGRVALQVPVAPFAVVRLFRQFPIGAKLVEDPDIAKQVYDNAPERERNSDPDREGTAILIDVDKVIARGEVLMER